MIHAIRRPAAWWLLLVLCLFVAPLAAADGSRTSPAERPPGAAVASAHSLATEAGLRILREGGNAFDAAIAVSATLSVVEPISSGIGGGGFFLLHDAGTGRDVFIDARETAPAAATPDRYLTAEGEFDRDRAENGPWAAGIPGCRRHSSISPNATAGCRWRSRWRLPSAPRAKVSPPMAA